MRTAEQRALYYARRQARLCTDCGADLKPLDSWTASRCPEHHQRVLDRSAARRASGLAAVEGAAHMARRYEERRAAGLCVRCPNPPRPAISGKICCQEHHEYAKERRIAYLDRKEAAL